MEATFHEIVVILSILTPLLLILTEVYRLLVALATFVLATRFSNM
ncbi:MAG: hypothetical protein HLUCCO02_11990 [Idiomarinaceae bacterium HL-53]|nr:MAG: hypothetical protein HLUCCO02_11990 [Idiomarinaceae bacterium HL-53]